MKLGWIYFVVGLAGLPLMGQINAPRIGTARYPDGSFHTVQGLPNNMIVAELPLDAALAASFSDKGGLVVQNGMLRLLGPDYSLVAEYPVAEMPVVSIAGELTSALAWLPQSHVLVHWTGSQFQSTGVAASDVDGTVTDLQLSAATQVRLMVEHEDRSVSGVTISLRNGNLVSSEPLPGVSGYTFRQASFYIYTAGEELVVDDLLGYRRSVTLPAADLVIERMSSSWLHLYSPTLRRNWALHLTQADAQLSWLPGVEASPRTARSASFTRGMK